MGSASKRLFILFLAWVFIAHAGPINIWGPRVPAAGGNTVTIDTSAKGTAATFQSTRTISITVAANSNRALFVAVCAGDGTLADLPGASVSSNASGSFTHVTSSAVNDTHFTGVDWWRLVNPATGAHTITVAYTAEVDIAQAYAISLYNVDQTTPAGTVVTQGGTNASSTATVTLDTGGLSIGAFATDAQNSSAVTVGTLRQSDLNVNSDVDFVMATSTGATITITHSSDGAAISVVPVKPAP